MNVETASHNPAEIIADEKEDAAADPRSSLENSRAINVFLYALPLGSQTERVKTCCSALRDNGSNATIAENEETLTDKIGPYDMSKAVVYPPRNREIKLLLVPVGSDLLFFETPALIFKADSKRVASLVAGRLGCRNRLCLVSMMTWGLLGRAVAPKPPTNTTHLLHLLRISDCLLDLNPPFLLEFCFSFLLVLGAAFIYSYLYTTSMLAPASTGQPCFSCFSFAPR